MVWRRFESNRTEYGKLKRRIKEAKSGCRALKALTECQQWKLSHYAFYEPHLKRRRQDPDAELGNVSICRTRDLRIVLFLLIPFLFLLIPLHYIMPYK
jgi:hypothetical protein